MLLKNLVGHDVDGLDLEVGTMVLARYPVDEAVYRARVEHIHKDGQTDLFR
jgi:hypothetical protein